MKALENNLSPDCVAVQKIIESHHKWISQYCTPTKEIYIGYATEYCQNQHFKAFYQTYHQDLPEFLAQAMIIFADKKLS